MDTPSFNYHIQDSYLVFEILINELDLLNSLELREKMKAILEKNNYPGVILNLNSVQYIDSTGIGSLITLNNELKTKNKKMIIVCSIVKILKIFSLAKVDQFMTILPTMEEAKTQMK